MNKYKRVDILGVPVNKVSADSLEKDINKQLLKRSNDSLFIATVNASFILKCQNNPDFMSILHSSDINTADGVSIQMSAEYLNKCAQSSVSWFVRPFVYLFYGLNIGFIQNFRGKYTTIKDRVTGVYLAKMLLTLSNNKKYRVTVIHRADSLTPPRELLHNLKLSYPNAEIKVIPVPLNNYDKKIKDSINSDIVLCTFGEYKQEKFLSVNSKKLHCKIKIGIGGALDVIVGNTTISESKSKSGLEWFYRLLNNPKRVKKIFNSVFVYPAKVYSYSLK